MSTAEIEKEAVSGIALMTNSCSRLILLSAQFPAHATLFQSATHTLSQFCAKLNTLQNVTENSEVAPRTATRYLAALHKHSEQLSTLLSDCERTKKARNRDIREMHIIRSRLESLLPMFDSAIFADKTDLFTLDPDDVRWLTLKEAVKVHTFDHPAELKQKLNDLVVAIAPGSAFVANAFEWSGPTSRKLMLGLSAVYYSAFKQKALQKSRFSTANPTIDVVKTSWNLMDSQLMAAGIEKLTPKIAVNTVIFVPKISENDLLAARLSDQPATNRSFSLRSQGGDISIRVLSPTPLPALAKDRTEKCGCFGGVRLPADKDAPLKAIVFHIHGGGFIAMSSRSHQGYTRKWANDMDTVVFSVDYRLAPESPYPAALEDVWSAYLWVKAFAKRDLGVDSEAIVVTGDSAGGNLACGLINKAIDSGIEGVVPRGGLLSYPALYLSVDRYSPSLEVALEDMIVPHSFLKLCLENYVAGRVEEAKTDYYVSPLVTPDRNLARFPPIRVIVGNEDPFEDDCWRFTERLLLAGVDVKMTLYHGLPHGFLGFDLKGTMPEAREAIEEAARLLQHLLLKT